MRSPAHDIALYLAGLGVGTFGGATSWALAVNREPEAPDDVVTVYDTGGGEPFADIELYEPTIQVRARSKTFTTAYAKHEQIRSLLILPTVRMIGEADDLTRYVGIWMQSDILDIGRDENDRHLLTANYRILRQPQEAIS